MPLSVHLPGSDSLDHLSGSFIENEELRVKPFESIIDIID
jgi:hypothetical protein